LVGHRLLSTDPERRFSDGGDHHHRRDLRFFLRYDLGLRVRIQQYIQTRSDGLLRFAVAVVMFITTTLLAIQIPLIKNLPWALGLAFFLFFGFLDGMLCAGRDRGSDSSIVRQACLSELLSKRCLMEPGSHLPSVQLCEYPWPRIADWKAKRSSSTDVYSWFSGRSVA
jgi:hypothetical protein